MGLYFLNYEKNIVCLLFKIDDSKIVPIHFFLIFHHFKNIAKTTYSRKSECFLGVIDTI
jgi:hypothetical protein